MQAPVGFVAPAEVEFDTLVFHLTGVDPLRGAFAHGGDAHHLHQDVGGFLQVEVHRAVEAVAEHAPVEAGIVLSGGFPLDIGVADLVAFEAGLEDGAAVGAGDVVGSTVGLAAGFAHAVVGHVDVIAGGVGDFLVTGLTPRQAQLEVVEPRVGVGQEGFVADAPTC